MDAPTREIRTNHGAMEPPDLPIDTCEAQHWIGGHSHREWRTAHRPGDGNMISITLLSLPPETLQRMVSHDAASETGCRRAERILALGLTLFVTVAAVLVALTAG
jgi:hypothetical protein